MSVSREQILATKPPQEAVKWLDGGEVYVAAMSCATRDSFERENVLLSVDSEDYAHLNNFRARLLVRCLVNESGERLFKDDDASALGEVWIAPLDKAFEVAKRLNALSDADVEELEGNSPSATS